MTATETQTTDRTWLHQLGQARMACGAYWHDPAIEYKLLMTQGAYQRYLQAVEAPPQFTSFSPTDMIDARTPGPTTATEFEGIPVVPALIEPVHGDHCLFTCRGYRRHDTEGDPCLT